MLLQAIIGALCGIGLIYILCDLFGVPYLKTSKAVKSLAGKQHTKVSGIDIWLEGIATLLSKH